MDDFEPRLFAAAYCAGELRFAVHGAVTLPTLALDFPAMMRSIVGSRTQPIRFTFVASTHSQTSHSAQLTSFPAPSPLGTLPRRTLPHLAQAM